MASEIFDMSSIESFAPMYPFPTTDISDMSYENMFTNLDKEKIESLAPIYPISTTDFSEMSYGNILTDLDKEKILDDIFDECMGATNDDANFAQTSDGDIQDFLKEFLLISPKDTKSQRALNAFDNSEENLSRNAEHQLVTPKVENNEPPQFMDM